MPTITTTDGIEIFFKDWGSGQPIVFSHGWPLSGDDWDVLISAVPPLMVQTRVAA
jgi:non-heme chloroperoxidase